MQPRLNPYKAAPDAVKALTALEDTFRKADWSIR